jgi:hypothetical protein
MFLVSCHHKFQVNLSVTAVGASIVSSLVSSLRLLRNHKKEKFFSSGFFKVELQKKHKQ